MARFYPAKLTACEKELKKSLCSEGKHEEQNVDADVIEPGEHVPALESRRT